MYSPRGVVVLGATYKPDTYDLRESPALEIVELLKTDGYDVIVHDPLTREFCRPGTLVEIAADSDCVVLLVPHRQLVEDLAENHEQILAAMRNPSIVRFDH